MRLLRPFLFFLILCVLAKSGAQCGDPPDPWKTWSEYVAVCHKYYGHIVNRRCVDWDTNWCNRKNQPTPSTDEQQEELRQQQQAQAERKRIEELQRQAELERQRQEAEQERAREEWLATVGEAAKNLKGVSHHDAGLKGTGGGNTNFFGLKRVSRDEIATNSARPETSRNLDTASRQLMCASDIANYALGHFSNILEGKGTPADVSEIKYLAGEATNALQGNQVGVQCNSSAAFKFSKAPDLQTITPLYKAALDNIVRDSQQLYATQHEVAAAQQRVDEAKKRVEALKIETTIQSRPPSAASPTSAEPALSTGDPAVNKAYAEQKVGLPCALVASHLARHLLFNVSANDPATLAAVALCLAVVAAFAGYIPARRAMCVDPLVALRCE